MFVETITERYPGQHVQCGYKVNTANRTPITAKVRLRIIKATQLLGRGFTWKQAAKELGVSEHHLLDYYARHRQLWDTCAVEATKNSAELLKQLAGTAEIFENAGKLIRVANEAAKNHGEPIFPSDPGDGKQTLTEFLENVYLPSRIDVGESYPKRLRSAVARLVAFLGKEVTIDKLNEADLCRYLTALRKSRCGVTVNKSRQLFLTLWRSAYDNGLCERPPRLGLVRRVAEEVDPPEAWTADDCNRLFSTAARWKGSVGDIPAGKWWLSLLLSIYWTGCRISAILGTPAASYNGSGILVRKQKNHRPQWYSLPPTCCEAIGATFPEGRQLLWPWPQHKRTLWSKFRQIVTAAGLPCPKTGRQLFHRMRRTTLSLCAAIDPAIAQRQAGHANYATTLKHYIDPRIARGRGASDVLPEPVITVR